MNKTVADIIKGHGVQKIAEAIGEPERNVRMWRFRNRIPQEHWRDLAANKIATLEELAEAAAKSDAA